LRGQRCEVKMRTGVPARAAATINSNL